MRPERAQKESLMAGAGALGEAPSEKKSRQLRKKKADKRAPFVAGESGAKGLLVSEEVASVKKPRKIRGKKQVLLRRSWTGASTWLLGGWGWGNEGDKATAK
ncbi:hypothetical protein KC19_VG125400 [Ceratodon purpureus]|uniref:Uncharacterized protein n=1 Tax=Ceratodon purpureus TaxID=3225 RepID=A0A8T0HPR4_CERPU|nr:hypothetical protein KC19_VG125400 [Ceratodon purpureus]